MYADSDLFFASVTHADHCSASVISNAVSRIALVSPQRSQQIEAILLRMAQTGQLRGRVSENQLIDLLEQVRLNLFALVYAMPIGRQAEDAQSKGAPKKGTIVVRVKSSSLAVLLNDLRTSSNGEREALTMMTLISNIPSNCPRLCHAVNMLSCKLQSAFNADTRNGDASERCII